MLGINLKLSNQNQSSKYPIPLSTLFMPLEDNLDIIRGTGPAIFTRSGIGTSVNRITRLVENSSANAARFETNGVLIEGTSKNEALHNRDLSNAVYMPTNIIALKDAIGADGIINSASTVTATSNGGVIFQPLTLVSAQNTFSVDIRRKTGTGTVEITDDGGSTFTDVTSSLNSVLYTRFQITTTQANPSVGFRLGISGDEIEVDYIGLELLPFASSRIETTTLAVTRASDNLSIDVANIPASTADYSVSAEVDKLGFVSGGFARIYDVDGDTRHLRVDTASNKLTGRHSTQSFGLTSIIPNMVFKVTFTVGSANQTLYFNGVQEDQDAKGVVAAGATGVDIGRQASGQYLFGHIKNFRIYDVALTAEQAARVS